jgi:hypothetical protein
LLLFKIVYLENSIQDGLVGGRGELPDRKKGGYPNAILGTGPEF